MKFSVSKVRFVTAVGFLQRASWSVGDEAYPRAEIDSVERTVTFLPAAGSKESVPFERIESFTRGPILKSS